MDKLETVALETDSRFPSGPWTGYWLQGALRGIMEIRLTFSNGVITAEGRDWVGPFIFRGRYSVEDGKCYWTKRYVGQHDVFYQGYNEGKGIWGVWELQMVGRGGFHIWPEGMAVDDALEVSAEADIDDVLEDSLEPSEPLFAPIN